MHLRKYVHAKGPHDRPGKAGQEIRNLTGRDFLILDRIYWTLCTEEEQFSCCELSRMSYTCSNCNAEKTPVRVKDNLQTNT